MSVRFNRADDYVEWIRERDDIHNSLDEDALKEEDVVTEVVDDADHAAQFLRAVGFSSLAQSERDADPELYSLLTINQLATVKKRLETVRSRVKSHRPDVRNIFQTDGGGGGIFSVHQTDGTVIQSMKNVIGEAGRKNANEKDAKVKGSTDPVKSREAEPTSDAGKSDEIYIPPPDYPSIGQQIIQVGIEMVRPKSPNLLSPRDKTRDVELPGSGRLSPTPEAMFSYDDGSSLTRISDLGRKDLKTLSALANIDLMSVFDEYNIEYVQHKSKKKGKDHGVYGVPLQNLSDRDRKKSNDFSGNSAPMFLQLLIEYLEKTGLKDEGILRVPGAMARMRELRQEIDAKWPRGKFSFDGIPVNDAAGLLKQFLRDLPDSLLTLEKMDAFLKILDIPDEKKQLYALNLLLIILPSVNRDSLQLLLGFLRKIIDEPRNRMTLSNVAMIIAPNLFVIRSAGAGQVKPGDIEAELQMAAKTSQAVMMLIEFKDDLCTVPQSLLAQIRQKNDTRKTRINLPVIGRRDRSDAHRQTPTFDRNSGAVIQVSLEDSSNEAMIQITDLTTSNDVINQMILTRSPKPNRKALKSTGNAKLDANEISGRQENALSPPSSSDASFLYEVGGNIGERRLDGTAHLMSVIQVNPNAKFIVRQRPT